ncbi:MAG TPA: hypothetical protein VJ824_17910 [Bacillota bacterium]|nr:hypothetical protein [Bacillota bacterium]
MRKLIIPVISVIFVFLVGAFIYIYPQEKLDMSFSHFAVSDIIREMIKSKNLEFHLSEIDVNNLIKPKLSSTSLGKADWEITGTHFELNKDQLIAHVNLRYLSFIQIGTTTYYQLTWEKPEIQLHPQYTQIRSLTLPKSWFSPPDQSVSLESMLPSFLKVENVLFEQNDITIHLRLS